MMTKVKTIVSNLLPKSRFARGVAALSTATAVGQAIAVFTSPIITRLYSPDDFGVLAVYTAILGIVTAVSSLRYELAIPLPYSQGSAANVFALSLITLTGVSALSCLVVVFWGEQIVTWSNTPQLGAYLWLLPLGIALGGAYQVFNYWALRRQAFGRLARTQVQRGGGMAITKIALGLAEFGTLGLIIGQVIGQCAGLGSLVYGALREDGKILKRIRFSRIRWAARRYRQFPLYSTWSALANAAGTRLPLMLFASFFSPTVAGLYMLGYRVLHMPMELLGNSIGKVFHASAAEARRDNRLGDVTLQVFNVLVRIGIGPMVLLAVVAPELFSFVFGPDWCEAGVYVRWMVPWLTMVFITSPLSTIVSVIEKQALGLAFQLSLLILSSFAVIAGAFWGEPLTAIALYAMSGFLVKGVFLIWLMHYNNIPVVRWSTIIGGELIRVLPFALLLWWLSRQLQYWFPEKIGSLLVVGCSALLIGTVFLWRGYYYGLKRN